MTPALAPSCRGLIRRPSSPIETRFSRVLGGRLRATSINKDTPNTGRIDGTPATRAASRGPSRAAGTGIVYERYQLVTHRFVRLFDGFDTPGSLVSEQQSHDARFQNSSHARRR